MKRLQVNVQTGEVVEVELTPEEVAALPPPAPPPVPAEVTMRQAHRALRRVGKLAEVEALIAAMPGEAGEDARIDWGRSQTVQRRWPLVLALAPALGLTDADLDQLFVLAATL